MKESEELIHLLAVELFNAVAPVGTSVTWTRDDGSRVETRTRSEAWQLDSGHAVVQLVGQAGGVALERVKIPAEAIHKARAIADQALQTAERRGEQGGT